MRRARRPWERWGLEREGWSGDGEGSSLLHGLGCSLEDREQGKRAFHPSGNGTERSFGWENGDFVKINPIPAKTGNGRRVLARMGFAFPPFGTLPVDPSLKVRSLRWLRSSPQSHPGLFPARSRQRGSAEGRGGLRELRELREKLEL